MSLLHGCTWLNDTAFSAWLREAPYPYPVLLIAHIFTIALFGATVGLAPLRVLGWAFAGTSIRYLLRQTRPWKWGAFVMLLVTGLLIAASDPLEYYGNVMFWISLLVLGLIGLNAWYFRTRTCRDLDAWDTGLRAPPQARWWAGCSLSLWIVMIFAGRAIAFF